MKSGLIFQSLFHKGQLFLMQQQTEGSICDTDQVMSNVPLLNPLLSCVFEIVVVLFVLSKAYWRDRYLSHFSPESLEKEEEDSGASIATSVQPEEYCFSGPPEAKNNLPAERKYMLHQKRANKVRGNEHLPHQIAFMPTNLGYRSAAEAIVRDVNHSNTLRRRRRARLNQIQNQKINLEPEDLTQESLNSSLNTNTLNTNTNSPEGEGKFYSEDLFQKSADVNDNNIIVTEEEEILEDDGNLISKQTESQEKENNIPPFVTVTGVPLPTVNDTVLKKPNNKQAYLDLCEKECCFHRVELICCFYSLIETLIFLLALLLKRRDFFPLPARLHLLSRAGIMIASPTLAKLIPAASHSLRTNLDIMSVFISLCFFFSWVHLVLLDAVGVDRGTQKLFGGGALCSGAFSFWSMATTGSFPGEMLDEFYALRWSAWLHVVTMVLLCTILMQFLLATVMSEYSDSMKAQYVDYQEKRKQALQAAFGEIATLQHIKNANNINNNNNNNLNNLNMSESNNYNENENDNRSQMNICNYNIASLGPQQSKDFNLHSEGLSLSLLNSTKSISQSLSSNAQDNLNLSHQSRRQLINESLQHCHSGKPETQSEEEEKIYGVTLPSLRRLVRSINSMPYNFEKVRGTYIDLVFTLLDSDCNGYVDKDEWFQVCEVLQSNIWVTRQDSRLMGFLEGVGGLVKIEEEDLTSLESSEAQDLVKESANLKLNMSNHNEEDQKNNNNNNYRRRASLTRDDLSKSNSVATQGSVATQQQNLRSSSSSSNSSSNSCLKLTSKTLHKCFFQPLARRLFFCLKSIQQYWVLSGRLSNVMYFILAFNSLIVVAEDLHERHHHSEDAVFRRERHATFADLELCFSLIYVSETLLKISTLSWAEYWYSSGVAGDSNRFDFLTSWLLLIAAMIDDEAEWLLKLVGVSTNDQEDGDQVLTFLRISRFLNLLRVLKLIQLLKKTSSYRMIFTAVEDLYSACEDVVALLFVTLFTFASVGTAVWGGTDLGRHTNFRTPEFSGLLDPEVNTRLKEAGALHPTSSFQSQQLKFDASVHTISRISGASQTSLSVLNFNDLFLSLLNCFQIWVNTTDPSITEAMDVSYEGPKFFCLLLEFLNENLVLPYISEGLLGQTKEHKNRLQLPVTSIRYGLMFQVCFFFIFTSIVGNIFIVWIIQIVGCVIQEKKDEEKQRSQSQRSSEEIQKVNINLNTNNICNTSSSYNLNVTGARLSSSDEEFFEELSETAPLLKAKQSYRPASRLDQVSFLRKKSAPESLNLINIKTSDKSNESHLLGPPSEHHQSSAETVLLTQVHVLDESSEMEPGPVSSSSSNNINNFFEELVEENSPGNTNINGTTTTEFFGALQEEQLNLLRRKTEFREEMNIMRKSSSNSSNNLLNGPGPTITSSRRATTATRTPLRVVGSQDNVGLLEIGERLEQEGLVLRSRENKSTLQQRMRKKVLDSS